MRRKNREQRGDHGPMDPSRPRLGNNSPAKRKKKDEERKRTSNYDRKRRAKLEYPRTKRGEHRVKNGSWAWKEGENEKSGRRNETACKGSSKQWKK